jgi:hypothetical protein
MGEGMAGKPGGLDAIEGELGLLGPCDYKEQRQAKAEKDEMRGLDQQSEI